MAPEGTLEPPFPQRSLLQTLKEASAAGGPSVRRERAAAAGDEPPSTWNWDRVATHEPGGGRLPVLRAVHFPGGAG